MRALETPNEALPQIPDKRYFAIGEVAVLCDVRPHVLRYWEQEFPQLKPLKRRGNRRYYQQDDVQMVRTIRGLLYEEGFTITGARQRLRDLHRAAQTEADTLSSPRQDRQTEIGHLRDELESLLRLLPAKPPR
jgi:DNA-binding transcriptional MerR regulator